MYLLPLFDVIDSLDKGKNALNMNNSNYNTYAFILAGGTGTRMGADLPKQFLEVCGRTILSYTVEVFLNTDSIDRVIILTPSEYYDKAEELLKSEFPNEEGYDIVQGGELRNDTIMNGIKHVKRNYHYDEDTVIITHDAVRPFVTEDIISNNMKAMESYIACDTVIPATDTIVESVDHKVVSAIPMRQNLFQGQTPQTFKMLGFERMYNSLGEEEKQALTDAVKVFVEAGEKVALVPGDTSNIKITYPFDLVLAESIIKSRTN